MSPSGVAARWAGCAPELRSVLRIIAALLFITFGTMKLFNVPSGMPGGTTVTLASELGLAATLELVGGTLMLIGLFSRPVAFVLSGEMAVAYFQGHFPHGFWPVQNQGTPAVLYCFVWLYFSAAGPGPWSIDALRRE